MYRNSPLVSWRCLLHAYACKSQGAEKHKQTVQTYYESHGINMKKIITTIGKENRHGQ